MASHDIKLVLSDIDGTILPYKQPMVSERMRSAMHAALDAGIRVGPASGRGISHVAPAFGGDQALVATALGTNGMQVHLDGRLIHEEHLPHEALEHVVEVIKGHQGIGAIIFDPDGIPLLVQGTREDLAESFPVYARQAVYYQGIPSYPVVKMNVFIAGGMEPTRAAYDLVANEVTELDFNIPMAGFLNLTPIGYSKATGVDILCDALGITLDQVITCGDSGNDLEMLEHVPNSVAVSNATDEAKAAARWIVGACEDDAIADVLEALASGQWPFKE